MVVYVTMIDRFMSGWGKAEGKIDKIIVTCENMDEALIVIENLKYRTDMKYVTISKNLPRYRGSRYLVEMHDKKSYPEWFEAGYGRTHWT